MTDQQESHKLIPPHGGYRDLQSYQMSEIAYDGTVVFCDRFINLNSRHNYNYAGGLISKLSIINRCGFVISVSI